MEISTTAAIVKAVITFCKQLVRQNMRVLFQLLFGILILYINPYIKYGNPELFQLVLRKIALVAIGASFAHLTWKNLMYYAHTRKILENETTLPEAIKYLGLNIFRGMYYLSWILGIALGL